MPKDPTLQSGYFFKGQFLHFLLLAILVYLSLSIVDLNRLSELNYLGTSAKTWFLLSLAVPVLHQVYVWLAWRSELCFGFFTGKLGTNGFLLYRILFFVLIVSRLFPLIFLTIADHDSFE